MNFSRSTTDGSAVSLTFGTGHSYDITVKQAEAEDVPSSSLVEVEVGVEFEVGLRLRLGLTLRLRLTQF